MHGTTKIPVKYVSLLEQTGLKNWMTHLWSRIISITGILAVPAQILFDLGNSVVGWVLYATSVLKGSSKSKPPLNFQ